MLKKQRSNLLLVLTPTMTKHYHALENIAFPPFSGVMVNMMPIIVGEPDSLPDTLKSYQDLIDKTSLEKGSIAYLTVRESVIAGSTQSRPGIHVEAPSQGGWGGGGKWGGISRAKGIYMASNDGACNIWDEYIEERDTHGACMPTTKPTRMSANTLYWLTDRTPHEALLSESGTKRQFFRLVSDEVSVWYSRHNTPNPLGVRPACTIVDYDKFAT